MKDASFNAARFDRLMSERGFTDGKMAYASGVSRTMIYYMRKGKRERVSAEIVAAVAAPLRVSAMYLMGQTDDPSPVQSTMSPITADIVAMVEKLPPSKQREYQELGNTLLAIEDRASVETIYGELMEGITRLAEIEGGVDALDKLVDHLTTASGRSPSSTVARRRRAKNNDETIGEPSKSSE